jgi:O-acetyl-ADP-ribose deacetylase (regulator of RNase III)
MTRWDASHSDLLDAEADGLICSANPNLNLSGGVGGAFALRYGNAMQTHLHEYLRKNDLRFVEPGHAVVTPPCDSPFSAVAHAVSIDAFYDTDAKTILRTYDDAIRQLGDRGCVSIAAACLGCGYGRVSDSEFAEVAAILFTRRYDGISRITLTTTNADLVDAIRTVLAGANG